MHSISELIDIDRDRVMIKKVLLLICSILLFINAYAQVSGVVLDSHGEPMIGANVYWAGTGVGVATDIDGSFTLMPVKANNTLVASFVGYHNDTTVVLNRKPLTIVLIEEAILDEVTITERKLGVLRSRTSAFDTHTIGTEELCRAACCNLSEAFETNASVDVSYADAATGAKQIRLLGLSGTYVQLLQENTPGVRGLAQTFGLSYIPGPWMSSIQVSKGTSSVINGYEATSGQINVELLKPQTQNPLSVNLMLNSELHAEANIMGGWEIMHDSVRQRSLHTGIMAHYQQGFMAMDENKDSFVDMPKSQNANLINRWAYTQGDYTFQALVRGLYDKRLGGQLADTITHPYHIDLTTWRVEGFMKNGYVFDHETGSSIALITAASYHDQQNQYGHKEWNASQLNVYLNAIYQGNWEGGGLIDNDHRLSAGLSVNYDRYREQLSTLIPTLDRDEVTPGVFAEYSYTYADQLSLVTGVRADWSSRYGFFFTPRANVRYSPFTWWTIRASAGMGYRSPNAIADNANILPSSRQLMMAANAAGEPNIQQERAVNAGLSTTFYIPIASRELQLSMEYYHTHFINSLIVDFDQDPHQVHIYNQSDMPGAQSFAHSAQIEATMEVLRGWTWTAAFRWTDIKQTTIGADGIAALRQKPLTNQFKGVITTSYQTPLKKWQFDLTAQFNGGGRMPDGRNEYWLHSSAAHQYYEGDDGTLYYKWYPQLMAQITKYFRTCSIYVGAENMTNFKQQSPIIGATEPFGTEFDASMAWGNITGWKVYLGFRYDLERPDE